MTPHSPYRDQGVPALVHGAARPLRPAGQHLPRSMRETCWSDHVAFDERGEWLGSKAPRSASRLSMTPRFWPRALWLVTSAIVLPLLASRGLLDATLALALFVGSNVLAYIVADTLGEFPPALVAPPASCVVGWSENKKRTDGQAYTCPTAGPARQYVAGLNAIVRGESSWALERDALRRRREELANAVAELAGGETTTDEATYKGLEAHIACAYSDFVWREFVVDPDGDAPPPFFDSDEAWDAIVDTCENIVGSWGALALAAWWYERQGDRVRARELLHAELSKANAHELRERMPALWSWIETREPGWVAVHRPAESERMPGIDTRVATDGSTEARPAAVANRGSLRAPASRSEGGGEDEEDVSVYEVSKRSSGR